MSPRRLACTAILAALASAAPPAHSGTPSAPVARHRPKPDLKVRVELGKQRRADGVRVRMRFRVINAGDGPAAPSTLGAWCLPDGDGACGALDGHYEQGPPIEAGATGVVRLATPAIPAGGAVVVMGPATRPWSDGHYTIRAIADVLGAVAETIEANNRGQAGTNVP